MSDYKTEVEAAKQNALRLFAASEDEYERLFEERESVEKRILQVRQDMEHFALLAGIKIDDPSAQFGLTDSIRYVLGTASRHLTAAEIKVHLERASYITLSDDPMPSILTVLRRLNKAKEVEILREKALEGGGYAPGYKWVGGLPPSPPAPKRSPFGAPDSLANQMLDGRIKSNHAEVMERAKAVLIRARETKK